MNRSLIGQLSTGWHAFRQLGPRRGFATAARRLAYSSRGRYRAMKLERRPIQASPAELDKALAGRSGEEALAASLAALPSVAGWMREVTELEPGSLAELVRRADDVLLHRFDLLGSGPSDLGPEIDWHRDFKAGRSWPLVHISKIPVSYPDSSDIKVPWELSRCQHLPLLAAAFGATGDRRYFEEVGAQLTAWVADNPIEFGVNWACTMDVAIRVVNWVAALALCAADAAAAPWFSEVLGNLLMHARFIRGHLEYGSARGNHYLSDVVGLLVVASLFSASEEGRNWIEWAVSELGNEMRHQVRDDGCDHEASTSYHRLVTELFIVGADAADAVAPGRLDPGVRRRLDQMLQFVADYTRLDGLAPQIGDADNGRLLPLDDYASADQRSHLHLFKQASRSYRPAERSAAYPSGGFYFLRSRELYVAVRCGDVGIYGRGCHAHNDLLAFELCYGATPVVIDPGSYLYTADPVARNRFRATASHSALQVDGAEQNEIRSDRLFAMIDRAHAEVTAWDASTDGAKVTGRHRGYEVLADPVILTRSVSLSGESGTLEVVDEVVSRASHQLSLRLALGPSEVSCEMGKASIRFPDFAVTVESDRLTASLEQGWVSQAYGTKEIFPVLRFDGQSVPGRDRLCLVMRFRAGGESRA